MALHNNTLYAFLVDGTGLVFYKRLFLGSGSILNEPWEVVPGIALTDVKVAATMSNGRLILCAKGIGDQQIYLNELAPGGRSWSGWSLVPGKGYTNSSPALAAFQDELYLFIRNIISGHILTKVRLTDGDWTDWAELPGWIVTHTPVAATVSANQLLVFLTNADESAHYVNVSSDTGTWSRWQPLPNSFVTDALLAATSIGASLYLFARGIDDYQIYMRSTI
jgi:hypothetical protein